MARKRGEDMPQTAQDNLNKWAEYFTQLLNDTNTLTANTPISPADTDLDISTEDFTETEFDKALRQCKLGKSPGTDAALRPETLRFAGIGAQKQILRICNSVLNGYPPPWQWTTNIIIPVPKKASAKYMDDYRGITLMSVAAKIYNRMLLNRIYDPVNSLLRPEQSGFRRGRSCIEQIHILRRVMEGFHKKQLTLVSTFIDFRKAFDSIDRGKIHEILRHYGIPPKITSAIMILYDKNKSTVMIDGRMSTQFYVTKGVLQGDTLAPFLFIIVLDYILRQTELGSYRVPTHQDQILYDLDFADDIVFFDNDAAADHVTCLQESTSSVGLNINF